MDYKENNNDFFSYNGTINRKNYIINLFILVALYITIYFVRFENFVQFTNQKYLLYILLFFVSLFKFVIVISAISVVYRRITDISFSKTKQFKLSAKRIFTVLYVFPLLHLYCIRYFLDIIPPLVAFLDSLIFFVILPLATIVAIVLCFIKGK